MSPLVVGLALFAAILHASWNAFLRTGADRLWTVTVMSFSSTALAIPLAVFNGFPATSALPYVGLSACLQVGYSVFLVAAYRYGELGQVYPIVRGSVPLLVTLGGLLLAGQQLTVLETVGVALVGGGIMGLSLGRGRAATTSILYALATGAIIAAYATVDAIGVRAAGNVGAYTAWVLLAYGVLLPATFVASRGRLAFDPRAPETWKALGGGLFSLLAYGVVVTAFALGPAGPITAIRETSVVFAAFIGRLLLGETLTPRRVGACAVVVLGAICLGYQP
ncbi:MULTISPECIES: DMT family transporter [Mesorhizobium]|uniref:Multidrug DMT transporter permease n=1 Tax=Rhizobium loti TaxID=381 RepID=A0A6M7U9Y3_RHILI|nr:MULTISPECIES: DMT family transporter [Mesorhizobium]KRB31891.1 multidrug DMT transporter permease [Mesorhizobium sp. Root172]OBQ72069.1 multidrug DMT transporter permease [Mesorhizobium loti]QKC72347.1 EamA family transporter [Mesorhizobium loti]